MIDYLLLLVEVDSKTLRKNRCELIILALYYTYLRLCFGLCFWCWCWLCFWCWCCLLCFYSACCTFASHHPARANQMLLVLALVLFVHAWLALLQLPLLLLQLPLRLLVQLLPSQTQTNQMPLQLANALYCMYPKPFEFWYKKLRLSIILILDFQSYF